MNLYGHEFTWDVDFVQQGDSERWRDDVVSLGSRLWSGDIKVKMQLNRRKSPKN